MYDKGAMCLGEPHQVNVLKLWGFRVSCPLLYCCSSFFCSGSFVELVSADKPAGDALPDTSENGPTDHTLIEHLAHVGYVGYMLHVPLLGTAQLTALISGYFCNTKRDLIIFYLVKI